jgi:hypothetical protein
MSVSVYYQPISKAVNLENATQIFVKAMEKTFGEFPISLDSSNLNILEAMGSVLGDEYNPYSELVDAIENYGEVLVTVSY